MTTTFEVGQTYGASFIGDSALRTNYTVLAKTSMFFTLRNERTGAIIRKKVNPAFPNQINLGDGEFLHAEAVA